MKKKLLAICLLLTVTFAKAQSWCPTGAEWYFSINNPVSFFNQNPNGYILFKYRADTTIALVQKKVIQEYFIGTLGSNPNLLNLYRSTSYLHENNSVVFLNNDTLYNFNAAIGDVWLRPTFYQNYSIGAMCDGPRKPIKVIDTGHVVVNSTSLRTLTLEWTFKAIHTSTSSPITTQTMVAIERISLANSIFTSQTCEFMNPPQTAHSFYGPGLLRCYKDNTSFGTYQNPQYSGICNFISTVGLKKNSTFNEIKISPNPANSEIKINLNANINLENKNIGFSIANTLGQITQSGKLTLEANSTKLKLENLTAGVYFLTLTINNENKITQKIIKE